MSTKDGVEEGKRWQAPHLLQRFDDGIEASLRARLVRLGDFRC